MSEFFTRSGIPVKEVYTQDDLSIQNASGKINLPGEYPYVRGVQKDMYRGRMWTMRQYAGFGTAQESNQRYRYLLAQGTTGLSVAFDLPTQLGLDPDHPRSRGEVGKVGVSVSTLDDMRTLFDQIDLSQVSTSMTINATASILLAFYVCVAEEKKIPLHQLKGTIQNDILKEYIARGNYIYPAQGALRLTTDLFDWCSHYTPKWNPISISGYHIREAGSTAVQELAFTFANAIAYVENATQRGLPIESFIGRVSFFFNVHSDFFEEISKFRAARKIWARLTKERFKVADEKLCRLRFHSQTAGSTLTAQQPNNNVVRVTLQALSSVLGGTQSLHTNSLDEALSLPSEESAQLALRTQQVIAFESQVSHTVDPLAGSYFVESLTAEIEKQVWSYLEKIDSLGGAVKCIENGFIQNEIINSAYHDQRLIDQGKIQVVGVNCFEEEVSQEHSSIQKKAKKVSEDIEKKAVQRVKAYRLKRNAQEARNALDLLTQAAQGSKNLQPFIIEAAKKEATLGEISDALRNAMGEYQPFVGF